MAASRISNITFAASRRRLIGGLAATGLAAAAGRSPRADGAPAASHAEPVRFASRDGTVLAGDIHLPGNAPPALGVVYVDGGGMTPRKQALGAIYAAEGIALLTYDKRGVAESGGVYAQQGSFSRQNLQRLAEDASAAIDALAAHPRLRNRPIGLVGASQAGWIIPNTASMNDKAAFMVLISGPTYPVSTWIDTRIAARPDSRERLTRLRDGGADTDPREWLAKLGIPGLWQFGGKDDNVPTAPSIGDLSKLIAAGHTNYEYRLYPEGGHVDMGPSEDEAHRFRMIWMRRQAM